VDAHVSTRFEEQKMAQGEKGVLDGIDEPVKEALVSESSAESEESQDDEQLQIEDEQAKKLRKQKALEEKIQTRNVKLLKHFSYLMEET
jgi:hypothetical protein